MLDTNILLKNTGIKMIKKYRHELKFLLDDRDLFLVENQIKMLMKIDPHTDVNGQYVIRSVYFDDVYRSCFYDNENGNDPREKYRIRIYNCSQERISLEKKRKEHGMTGKESCQISFDVCMKMLRGENLIECMGQNELLDEWIMLRNQRLFRPVILGEYVRTPYVYGLGNVRVTFDRNIAATSKIDSFFENDANMINVLPTGKNMLEVKYDDFLPDVVWKLVNNGHMWQSTFSKFYLGCRAIEGGLY